MDRWQKNILYFQSAFNRFAVITLTVAVLFGGCAKNSSRSLEKQSLDRADVATLSDSQSSAKQTLTIWHDDFDVAQAEAQKSGRPILACFTGSDWCHWCVKLKDDVFEKPEFKQWANENVVLLELDYPRRSMQNPAIKQKNEALKRRYSISGYPTVLMLGADGEVRGKMGYGKDPTQWISSVESQLNSKPASEFVPN
jgi:protein disulfide-isomerase